VLLLKQQQREGLRRAERTELKVLNRISEQYTSQKNQAAIDAAARQQQADIDAAPAEKAEGLAKQSRQVKQAEEARDKALGEARPDFRTRFPNWATYQHVIPMGAGAFTGALLGGKTGLGQRVAAGHEGPRGSPTGGDRRPARCKHASTGRYRRRRPLVPTDDVHLFRRMTSSAA
jgi:hypothetical protein